MMLLSLFRLSLETGLTLLHGIWNDDNDGQIEVACLGGWWSGEICHQDIDMVCLCFSSRIHSPWNTFSGPTQSAADLKMIHFIILINFEDEFIAADKIANYQPLEDSLGSKLVSEWVKGSERVILRGCCL